ncbi:MAG: sulfatase-like hydrolase/transferase [Opitutales bacterium]
MKLRHSLHLIWIFGSFFPTFLLSAGERPNILWLTSEDNAGFLGCYGDANAQTPNLDKLAARGIRYTNFYANAPVCAVARSSWIFGVPAVTTGTLHMRSRYRVPRERFITYPELFRAAGYYVTNNRKTDYNTKSINPAKIWDESSGEAHFKNRGEGQPFFAVFNFTQSHESRIFPKNKPKQRRVPAEAIQVPPYQVASPETIDDWRAYYECMAIMDGKVGEVLKQLEASGEAENTIVVYCSDHAGVTLRTKRYLYDSGTRVPLIVFFPDKWQGLAPAAPGTASGRLAQFIDLPKTFLSVAGIEPPEVMPGHILFGKAAGPEPESVFLFSGRFDASPDNRRAVTDGRWKYIRNFESDRRRYQMVSYPMQQDGQRSNWEAYLAGKADELQTPFYQPQPPEELYDTAADPHEINNLVETESEMLETMRAQLHAHMLARQDLGLIPEPLMESIDVSGEETIYEFGQSAANYPLEQVLELAIQASDADPGDQSVFVKSLSDDNPIIRYWGIVGLRILGEKAVGIDAALEKALGDSDPSVRIQAAICIGRAGQPERAVEFLLKEAELAQHDMHAAWALDGIKLLDVTGTLTAYEEALKVLAKGNYSSRIVKFLRAGGTITKRPPRDFHR